MNDAILAYQFREARRYAPDAGEGDLAAFAERQRAARRRLSQLNCFYKNNKSRMARIHLLTACAVTLGRFCGISRAFDALGEALQPVDGGGELRTDAWRRYARACGDGRPMEVRDELWISAHVEDMQRARARGLDREFYEEAKVNEKRDPTYRLLRQHMEMTLDARLIDHSALAGEIPYETAVAQGMATALRRIVTQGGSLILRYAAEAARAIALPAGEPRSEFVSYRRAALGLILNSCTAWTASRVFRRGVRTRSRGALVPGDAWPLLSLALGDRVKEVHPLIVNFYRNPSRFSASATLTFHHGAARIGSRLATLLFGQGLYESDLERIDARFRAFRRADGSMHFIRELYCNDTLRVFDSDFVIKTAGGRNCLFEVFAGERLAARMDVEPGGGGSLTIRSGEFYYRGVRVPRCGLDVSFTCAAKPGPAGDYLEFRGSLLAEPRTRAGRFVVHRLLRWPRELGRICYIASPE